MQPVLTSYGTNGSSVSITPGQDGTSVALLAAPSVTKTRRPAKQRRHNQEKARFLRLLRDPDVIQKLHQRLDEEGYSQGILSNRAIEMALQDGRLMIDPLPPLQGGVFQNGESPWGTTAVTLQLGLTFRRFRGEVPIEQRRVDVLTPGSFKTELDRLTEKLVLEPGQEIELEPGQCLLGETLQRVRLAMTPEPRFYGRPLLAGLLTNLTRNARFFVGVEHANRIHNGDDHRFTLELYNIGSTRFVLTAGVQPVANLTLMTVVGLPAPHESHARGQQDPAGMTPGQIGLINGSV